jgi:quinol monooxygenase YgiN
MSHVYVTAFITPKSGQEETLEKELRAVMDLVRQEPGCIRYNLHRNRQGTTPAFLFYETWASMDALEKHANTPHIRAMREKTAALRATSTVQIWEEADVENP